MKNEFLNILDKIEQNLKTALPESLNKEWRKSSFGNYISDIHDSYINKLIEPNLNLVKLGGKRWRPLLLILTYKLFFNKEKSLPEEIAYKLCPLVEFSHTASLIHDDIEDSADLRRGKPAAHITYGLDTALNAASWLYFQASQCIKNPEIPADMQNRLYDAFNTELRKLHLGQAMDIYWHRNSDFFPSSKEYFSMVRCKTGTLASLAVRIACIAAGTDDKTAEEYSQIAANIGIGFQILDDVINLTTGNKGKKRGDDMVEGKKSLPVIRHVEKFPNDKIKLSELMQQASKEGIESEAIEEAIKLLESSNSINEAAKESVIMIKENCKKLNSTEISQLFDAMIPEDILCL